MSTRTRIRLQPAIAVIILLAIATASCHGRQITVARVIDGDTVLTTSGERIRLLGIDAPELHQDYGPQAREALTSLVQGKQVEVVRQRSGAYRRTDAVIKVGSVNVNEQQLRFGRAWMSYQYTPTDLRAKYTQLEASARARKYGLWANTLAVAPWQWRAERTRPLAGRRLVRR